MNYTIEESNEMSAYTATITCDGNVYDHIKDENFEILIRDCITNEITEIHFEDLQNYGISDSSRDSSQWFEDSFLKNKGLIFIINDNKITYKQLYKCFNTKNEYEIMGYNMSEISIWIDSMTYPDIKFFTKALPRLDRSLPYKLDELDIDPVLPEDEDRVSYDFNKHVVEYFDPKEQSYSAVTKNFTYDTTDYLYVNTEDYNFENVFFNVNIVQNNTDHNIIANVELLGYSSNVQSFKLYFDGQLIYVGSDSVYELPNTILVGEHILKIESTLENYTVLSTDDIKVDFTAYNFKPISYTKLFKITKTSNIPAPSEQHVPMYVTDTTAYISNNFTSANYTVRPLGLNDSYIYNPNNNVSSTILFEYLTNDDIEEHTEMMELPVKGNVWCDRCDGTGKQNNKKCEYCNGVGRYDMEYQSNILYQTIRQYLFNDVVTNRSSQIWLKMSTCERGDRTYNSDETNPIESYIINGFTVNYVLNTNSNDSKINISWNPCTSTDFNDMCKYELTVNDTKHVLNSNVTSYNDTPFTIEEKYNVSIRAINVNGKYSIPSVATIITNDPYKNEKISNLTISQNSDKYILSFNKINNSNKFFIKKYENSEYIETYEFNATNNESETYDLGILDNDIKYRFIVNGEDNFGILCRPGEIKVNDPNP